MPTVRPNILFLLSDQHSPFFLGSRGLRPVRTPHLDSLAARGTRFDSCHCASPLCVPSRMTLLTCRSCSDIGVWTNRCVLGSDIPTFVHYLNAADYETVLCGRMHFTGPDQRHGFQHRILGDVDPALGHISLATTGQTANGVRTAGPGRTAYTRYDEEVANVCSAFLERRADRGADKPFFLTAGFVLPHCPFICPKRLFDEYAASVDVPQLPDGYFARLHPAMKSWRQARAVDELTDDEVRIARTAYFGLVTYLDELIGSILGALTDSGLADNTIVVYASDHGEMAGEQRMWWKSSFYQGSVGVPLIVADPRARISPSVVTEPVSLLDLGPTFVDFAGGRPMHDIRGLSLRRTIESGADVAATRPIFAESAGQKGQPPCRMVRRGDWKLCHYHGYQTPQLFHLADDPDEGHDLGADDSCHEIREALTALVLADWDGSDVAQRVARQERNAAIVWPHPDPDFGEPWSRWTAPPDCNVFPET